MHNDTQCTDYCIHNFDDVIVSTAATPVLSEQPQNSTLLSNQTLVITCRVSAGAPFPSVVWTRNGVAVDLTERVRLQQYSASLQFESLVLEDSGEYACYLENVNGSVQSDSGLITVLGKTKAFMSVSRNNLARVLIWRINPSNYCQSTLQQRIAVYISSMAEWTCFDEVLSSHETDLDCGGKFCDPCNTTKVMGPQLAIIHSVHYA